MRHGRVAGHRDLVDLVELDAVALLQLGEQVVDGLYGEMLETIEAALALGIDDAADHVLAAGDLLVVGARGVDDAPGREVEEVGHDRGRPEVHGQTHAGMVEGAGVDAVSYTHLT